MSARQRALLYLVYWEDLRPADAAAVLRISEGSARWHLARARANLREVLQ